MTSACRHHHGMEKFPTLIDREWTYMDLRPIGIGPKGYRVAGNPLLHEALAVALVGQTVTIVVLAVQTIFGRVTLLGRAIRI